MALMSRFVPPLLIAFAISVAFSNTMTGDFLFDDQVSVVRNMSIRRVLPLSRSLWGPQNSPTAGRPVANLSFALNYRAGGLNVNGYHFVNIAFHVFNACLLFALIRRTLLYSVWDRYWRDNATLVAIAMVLPWIVHPILTESVAYVTQRTELLMAFFLLATLYAARRAWDGSTPTVNALWQVICFTSCALGMASKEVMVVAPIMVVLYDLTFLRLSYTELIKRRWPLYFSLALTWGILVWLLAYNPRGQSVGFGLSMGPLDYMKTQMWAISHYLGLAFWPADLCGDYGIFRITEMSDWLPGALLILCLVGLTVWAWFHCRVLAFLGLWFFLILAPTSSFVPIVSEPVAERRMYLPLVSLTVLIGIAMVEVTRRWSGRLLMQERTKSLWVRALLVAYTSILTMVLAGVAYSRNQVFQNEETFWSDVTRKRPMNARGFSSLGVAYFNRHQWEEALIAFQRSIEIEPSNADAHVNLANLYQAQQRYEESRRHLELALQSDPKHSHAMMNLGVWYFAQGKQDDALTWFEKAYSIDSSFVEPIQRQGHIFLDRRQWDDAIRMYRIALEIDPDSSATHNFLGNAFLAKNQMEEATESFQHAVRLDPNSASAIANLGTVFARQGDYQAACLWFEKAVEIEPTLYDAMYNLGNCYSLLDRTEDAIVVYQKAIALQPLDVSAWFVIGKAYLRNGNVDEARNCFGRVLQLKPDAPEARQELDQLQTK